MNNLKLLLKYIVGFIKLRNIQVIATFPILKSNKFKSLDSAKIFKSRIQIWDYLIDYFFDKDLDFYEFGVHKGDSIRYFSKKLINKNNNFTGFDSFEGLPEVYNHGSLSKGDFSTDGQIPNIDDYRVKFIKGFFNEKKNEIQNELKKSVNTKLVHFDADIYSSTLFLLFQLDNFTPYYALFDEFGGDEARALYDYLISTDKKIEISATTFDDRYKIVPGKTFMKIF